MLTYLEVELAVTRLSLGSSSVLLLLLLAAASTFNWRHTGSGTRSLRCILGFIQTGLVESWLAEFSHRICQPFSAKSTNIIVTRKLYGNVRRTLKSHNNWTQTLLLRVWWEKTLRHLQEKHFLFATKNKCVVSYLCREKGAISFCLYLCNK